MNHEWSQPWAGVGGMSPNAEGESLLYIKTPVPGIPHPPAMGLSIWNLF